MSGKVDFVLLWVDDSDEVWRESKESYWNEMNPEMNPEMNSDSRYRDWNLLKFWFRSVEKYAPWVNKIFFITEGHVPNWLNLEHEKLTFVKHADYIDKKYLPTFNSNVIELSLVNLKNLSEKFVLFNDDMFLNYHVKEKDFFKNDLPCDVGIFNPIPPLKNSISPIIMNNMEIINEHFTKKDVLKKSFKKFYNLRYGKHNIRNLCVLPWADILGFYDPHIPVSYNLETFRKVWDCEYDALNRVLENKFRTKNDLSHWLMRYWQICEGSFAVRKANFGETYKISDNPKDIILDIERRKHKVICLNDHEKLYDYENAQKKLYETFLKKFPDKSSYEF